MADGAEIVQIWGVIKGKRHTIFRNIKKSQSQFLYSINIAIDVTHISGTNLLWLTLLVTLSALALFKILKRPDNSSGLGDYPQF